MPSYSPFSILASKYSGTGQGEAIERIAALSDPVAQAFLQELDRQTASVFDEFELGELFVEVAEECLCRGGQVIPPSDFVRVVSIKAFLAYYSNKFVGPASPAVLTRMDGEINKIIAIHAGLSSSNLRDFLDVVLNVTGKLRRKGYPLWLTNMTEISGCATCADFVERLALPPAADKIFVFIIGRTHLNELPVIRGLRSAVAEYFSSHVPTYVDGMYFPAFVIGGATEGGASEYVSKLDNTDAIDWVEIYL